MHSEVREEDDKVLFDSYNESCVTLVAPSDHFHMIPHAEVFPQLMCRKLQWVLYTTNQSIRQLAQTVMRLIA